MLMGDFNLTVESKNLEVFMSTFDLEYMIKKPTCLKNHPHLNCIDQIKQYFSKTIMF